MVDHILRASLERGLIVTIMYDKRGSITMRNIKVLNIEKDHITAYCYLRKQNRIFKRENILSAAFIDVRKGSSVYA